MKKVIEEQEPEFNGKSYTKAEMKANGHKGLKVRMAMQKEVYEQLRDTHYTVSQLCKLTGYSKAWICRYILKHLKTKCVKKQGCYFIPKELLEVFEQIEIDKNAHMQTIKENINKKPATGTRGFSFGLGRT